MAGPAVGFAVLTDSSRVRFVHATVTGINAGWGIGPGNAGPNGPSYAAAFSIGGATTGVEVTAGCALELIGVDGSYTLHDPGGVATVRAPCKANR